VTRDPIEEDSIARISLQTDSADGRRRSRHAAGAYWGAWVAPAVAQNTRVCVYDRAGQGRSEAAAAPQDGVAEAKS
jgi:hypothetical protein